MAPQENSTPITRFLHKPELIKALGVSNTTFWRMIRDERFPKPVKLGPNTNGWRSDIYENWAKDPQAWAAKNQTHHA